MMRLRLDVPSGAPARLLLLGAHCDDIEIGCGGTIQRLLQTHPDSEVHWTVFTSTPEREREARAGAAALLRSAGRSEVTVHAFRDTRLPSQRDEVKDAFEKLKLEVSPDVIFTHTGADAHQDHRLVSELTWNTFRDHLVLEYEIPKYDGDLGRPNVFVPLTAAHVDHKVETIVGCFPSQRSHAWFDAETFRGLMRVRGVECNAPDRYAEAFHCRKLLL